MYNVYVNVCIVRLYNVYTTQTHREKNQLNNKWDYKKWIIFSKPIQINEGGKKMPKNFDFWNFPLKSFQHNTHGSSKNRFCNDFSVCIWYFFSFSLSLSWFFTACCNDFKPDKNIYMVHAIFLSFVHIAFMNHICFCIWKWSLFFLEFILSSKTWTKCTKCTKSILTDSFSLQVHCTLAQCTTHAHTHFVSQNYGFLSIE